MKLTIDYLQYQELLTIKEEEGKRYLYCLIRNKYLVMQPEELVRQLLILYLVHDRKYSINRISVEKGLTINKLQRRFDILIYDKDYQPFFLIECKAPKVKLKQEVFDQVARYNLALDVPYLLITNGLETYCCEINKAKGNYQFLSTIPLSA